MSSFHFRHPAWTDETLGHIPASHCDAVHTISKLGRALRGVSVAAFLNPGGGYCESFVEALLKLALNAPQDERESTREIDMFVDFVLMVSPYPTDGSSTGGPGSPMLSEVEVGLRSRRALTK